MNTYTNMRTHSYIHSNTNTCVYMHAQYLHVNANTFICTHTFIYYYTHIHKSEIIHTYIRTCTHAHIHITYVCIHICMHLYTLAAYLSVDTISYYRDGLPV